MRRALVGFSPEDLDALDKLSQARRVSRAQLIRNAVTQYIEKAQAAAPDDAAFGLWREKNIDALSYQTALREEW